MRLRGIFDRKKGQTVVIVQCRLSSTRLPRKALLPLGGRCVLAWTLAAMKKVEAAAYYLAVDTDSAEELAPVAKDCGYEFFAGPKEDVLERFCQVIRRSKADVVVRATADNPFLFYEAAQELLEEYRDRNASSHVDYITWTGLPHGSGVEIFDAHSLLAAATMTDDPYDHEHVGPALYNHKDRFESLFLKAPRRYLHPAFRTTIDTAADYRRAQAVVRELSAAASVSEPYTTEQILHALGQQSVQYPVLLVPSTQKGRGTGHLRRCLDCAIQTGADILIPLNASLEQCDSLVEEARHQGLYDFQIVRDISHADSYALAVTDLFVTESAFARSLSERCPVVAIDEGASDTGYADYLLDIIPSVGLRRTANRAEPGFIAVSGQKREVEDRTAPLHTALVVLGGEDPASLSLPTAVALARCGLQVTAVVSDVQDEDGESGADKIVQELPEELRERMTVVAPITNLRDKLFAYDLVVTHYGLTAFEASAANCAVILLGTSPLHEQLAESRGYVCVAKDAISVQSFEQLLARPERLYAQEGPAADVGSLADCVSSLAKGRRLLCPVCRNASPEKDPVVARTQARTFRRCKTCGMLYMSWTVQEKQTEYDHDYFYEDYQKQYGKTYEDDFATIKAQCVRRTGIIDYLYRKLHSSVTPSVLDVGCALGPFLDAANDAGWQVFGMDISLEAVLYVQKNLHYPAFCAPFPNGAISSEFGIDKFDAITMWYVIEHFQNVDEVLKAVSGLLKKGGIFAFSTPSASGVSARYNTDSFFAESPADHYTLWEPSRTAAILKRYGFEVVRIVSTGIHPERFPQVKQKHLKETSVQYRLLRSMSKVRQLGDTFEVYCKKVQ